jgi:hypothetical protein
MVTGRPDIILREPFETGGNVSFCEPVSRPEWVQQSMELNMRIVSRTTCVTGIR